VNILIADEPGAFSNAIAELLDKKEWAASMATEGFSFVKNRYEWNVIGDNLSRYLK